MSWTKGALLTTALLAAACSPSGSMEAPASSEPTLVKDLDRSFLGLTLGQPVDAPQCGPNDYGLGRDGLCRDSLGYLVFPADSIPTGLDNRIEPTMRDGALAKITATIEKGHSGAIKDNLIRKYGMPNHTPGDGELQWIDGYMAVLYLPARPHKPGLIVVTTQAENAAAKAAAKAAQDRPL